MDNLGKGKKVEEPKIKRVCKICGATKYYPKGVSVGCDKCNRIMQEVVEDESAKK